jgi:opacity protein-like surface antigen
LNGYYQAPTKHKVRPYLGGGVGYTRHGVSMGASGYGINYEFVGTGNTLGYQAKLGTAYQSTNQLEFFAEGAYRGFTMGISPYASLDSFGVQAGLRYHFQGGPAK